MGTKNKIPATETRIVGSCRKTVEGFLYNIAVSVRPSSHLKTESCETDFQ